MKISLVIPTRERARFLKESIATAVACDDSDIEILVSDNASTDDTKAIVADFSDARVKYVDTGRRVSMRQNFENAIEESTGDYVVMVGDDDGFLAGQVPFLKRILTKHQPDVLSWRIPTFGWPNDARGERRAGVRFIGSNLFHPPQATDCGKLRHTLAEARMGDLAQQPALYHGCVRKSYMESLRSASGTIIASKIPDVYFNFSAIIRGGNFLHTGHPFTINGYSLASTGGATHGYRSDDPRSNPAKRFAEEAETDPVQDVIPEFVKSIPFVLFVTLETARRELGAADFPVSYEDWYRHVLGHAGALEDETTARIHELLKEYAAQTGTGEAYRSACAAGPDVARTAGRLLQKTRRLLSFKLSAQRSGENTIFTAAQLMDEVLAGDYGRVLDGSLSPNAAWFRAIGRGAMLRLRA